MGTRLEAIVHRQTLKVCGRVYTAIAGTVWRGSAIIAAMVWFIHLRHVAHFQCVSTVYVCMYVHRKSDGYVCIEETDWSHGYVPVGRCLLVSISMAPGSASRALLFCWMERKRGGEGRERGRERGEGSQCATRQSHGHVIWYANTHTERAICHFPAFQIHTGCLATLSDPKSNTNEFPTSLPATAPPV